MSAPDTVREKWRATFQQRGRVVRDAPVAGKLSVRNLSAKVAELSLYDEIGFWGVTAGQFKEAIDSIKADKITLRINSPGGDVFDALAMMSAIQQHTADVTCVVDGWAASAASFVALAGTSMSMAPNAFLMIHRAWTVSVGNSADMQDTADTLDKVDGQIAAIYAGKTGQPAAAMLEMMAGKVDGTWFTAQEAKDAGFADAVLSDDDTEEAAARARAARHAAMRMRLQLADALA